MVALVSDLRRRYSRFWPWLLCLVISWPGLSVAQSEADETAAKTALIFAFAKFVEWPAEAFTESEADFTIGVIDDPAMYGALLPLAQKRMHGHGIRIVAASVTDDDFTYHMLYCSRAALEELMETHADRLHARHVLTIGEDTGFAENGGVLRLMLIDDHLGFVINSTAAQRAGLSLSSSLYHLAHSVLEESP